MSDQYRQPSPSAPRPYAFRPRADGTVSCRECGDTNWVEVGLPTLGTPTVRPCSRCRPETYERWAVGFPGKDRDERKHVGEPARPAPYVPPQPIQTEAF